MSCENCKKELAQNMLHFIDHAPTAYHAVAQLEERLHEQGFTKLTEYDRWSLQRGGKYYVTRNGSSLIAFVIPCGDSVTDYRVVSAHTDSPSFKLKDRFERSSDNYCKLNVERYGGMICSSWLDRPLSIAGRVLLADEQGIKMHLVNFDRPMAIIPNVAIHMDRSANDGKSYNAQVDMLPIIGVATDNGGFKKQLADEIGVEETQILSHDLYLYPCDKGYVWGAEDEMITSSRLDDLMCVYGALEAFETLDVDGSHVSVLAAFDNEEVGSQTLQGAASSLFEDTISRIEYFLGNDDQDRQTRLSRSLMLSADNAHAVHPNHPEFADAQNKPVIGGGVVLKFNAQQRYATDGIGAALLRRIAQQKELTLQPYANRSDMPGGSTLGNIASTRVPIRTIDIGLPQLAMHSAMETAGTADLCDYVALCQAFYRADIIPEAEEGYRMEV